MPKATRLRHRPAFHFLVIGALLFLGDRWWTAEQESQTREAQSYQVVFGDEELEQIRNDFQARYGQPPSPAEEKSLLELAIDEELLYREALNLGLLENDRSIQWWLIKKMRFVAQDPELDDDSLYREARRLGLEEEDAVIRRILIQKMRLIAEVADGPIDPSDEEVQSYFLSNRDQWKRPDRVSLRHIFLSRDRRGENLRADAERLLAEIDKEDPDALERQGDPFPLGAQHRARSEQQLTKVFGPEFARQAMDVEAGRWVGPIPSAYGLHLVYLDEKIPEEDAELGTVQNQVRLQLASEQRKDAVDRQLQRLRQRYDVQVGDQAAGVTSNAL